MLFGIADRCYTTLLTSFQNVTITWYRLSRSKVYLSHTLSTFLTSRTMACRYTLLTFLTQLNQERWSSATYLSTFLTPLNQERSCTHTYIPRGYADHPEDEFSHHTITQTIIDSTFGEFLLLRIIMKYRLLLSTHVFVFVVNSSPSVWTK